MNGKNNEALEETKKFRGYNRCCGRYRKAAEIMWYEWLFIVLVLASIIIAFILTSLKIQESERTKGSCRSTCDFGIILSVNLVFALVYTIGGTFFERPFELLASIVVAVILMVYCIVEYSTHGKNDKGKKYRLKLGRLIMVSVLGTIDIVLGCTIMYSVCTKKYVIFYSVGGDRKKQAILQMKSTFTSFLKFDFQLAISRLILFLHADNEKVLQDEVILGIGIPFNFCWILLGFVMVRYKAKVIHLAFWVLSVVEPIYVVYLIFEAAKHVKGGKASSASRVLHFSMIGGGFAAIIVRATLLILAVRLTRTLQTKDKKRLDVEKRCDEHDNDEKRYLSDVISSQSNYSYTQEKNQAKS